MVLFCAGERGFGPLNRLRLQLCLARLPRRPICAQWVTVDWCDGRESVILALIALPSPAVRAPCGTVFRNT